VSKTRQNLQKGFTGESEARNMYTFFAKVARKEGYHYIARIFEETADNETRHAKDQFARMGKLGDTAANLRTAMEGEDYEATEMYPNFYKEAVEEGETDAANLFQQIAKVEKHHRERFGKLLEMVENGTVFKREEPIKWKCSVCGFVHEGTEPPEKCPACKHPMEYYEPANLDI